MDLFKSQSAAKSGSDAMPESPPVRIWREGLRRNPPELRYLPFSATRDERSQSARGAR